MSRALRTGWGVRVVVRRLRLLGFPRVVCPLFP